MKNSQIEQKVGEFLKSKLEESGAEGYVLGLSGGMDSAIAATTVSQILGPDKLTCWIMPGAPSKEENMSDARRLAEELDVKTQEADIHPVVEEFTEQTPIEVDKKTKGNIRARVRMVYEYMDANQNNKLVLGADNKSEIELGYFTKYGDGAVDVAPFAELYKTELKDFGKYIGIDKRFIKKKPTAGLWESQTDKSELGDAYSTIDPILKCLVERGLSVEETASELDQTVEKVQRYSKMVENSLHKRTRPARPELRKL